MADYSINNRRMNGMTRMVFTTANLAELQQAIKELFDLFYDVMSTPITSYADLKDRLDNMNEGRLSFIRGKYLDHDEAGYSVGDFSKEEQNCVVKLFLDLLANMANCTTTLAEKVDSKQQEMKVLENKLELMEERIRRTDGVIQSQKDFYTEKVQENNDLTKKNKQLFDQLQEKISKIHELEKLNNVLLWEQEKKRCLAKSTARIQELEKEVEELKQNNESCKRKLTTLESSNKRMMMRSQLKMERLEETSEDADVKENSSNNTVRLAKQNFMQDKDIVYLEKQLYDLQTTTVGLIGGMKCDFNQMSGKFIDETNGHVDEGYKMLRSRMDTAYKAVAECDVQKVKEVLPAHYKYIEDDKFKVKRIRRLSQPMVMPSQRVINNILDEKKPVLSPIPAGQNGTNTTPAPTAQNGRPVSTNPVIVDPVTKKLHAINPLKYFPFMSQAFILDQYKKFNEYDENGDGSLDLPEMVHVVKGLGFSFNPHQLQEAMEEVDRDGNNSLDFFEYMLVIDNIYRRNGKAELFQQGFNELRKKNMSKACVIQ